MTLIHHLEKSLLVFQIVFKRVLYKRKNKNWSSDEVYPFIEWKLFSSRPVSSREISIYEIYIIHGWVGFESGQAFVYLGVNVATELFLSSFKAMSWGSFNLMSLSG